jgi:hypothetical protein
MPPAEVRFAHHLRVLWRRHDDEHKFATETTRLLSDEVFAKHPQLFGADTPEQRVRWAAELRWARTVIETRAFEPQFESDTITLIPLLGFLNHRNDRGSLSFGMVASAVSNTTITAYAMRTQMSYQVVW